MAVVMGGRVREVANIKSAIRDQRRDRGHASRQDEVEILSKMLRTGALPASLNYLEDRTVGASLGADSIREGVTAAIVGVLVVMVFMLVYYRGSGINADLALILNLVILLGFMGFSNGATLTLPGIAGVILTIGMGVDSNVLIFERIREEVRAGKAPSAAVDQGFAHAWVTIVDTHVTTIVSAAILFLFGTGPVKGFATTLTIRSAGQPLHGGVCLARHLRGAPEQDEARRDGVDLDFGSKTAGSGISTGSRTTLNAGAPGASSLQEAERTSGIVSRRKCGLAGEEVVLPRLFPDLQRGRHHLDGLCTGRTSAARFPWAWISAAARRCRCSSSRRRTSAPIRQARRRGRHQGCQRSQNYGVPRPTTKC